MWRGKRKYNMEIPKGIERSADDIKNLLGMLKSSGKKYDIDKITAAYLYAADLHEGQFRNSGEPYIVHPVAVAEIVAALGLDTDSICAAFLHDTVEDCSDTVSYTHLDVYKRQTTTTASLSSLSPIAARCRVPKSRFKSVWWVSGKRHPAA